MMSFRNTGDIYIETPILYEKTTKEPSPDYPYN